MQAYWKNNYQWALFTLLLVLPLLSWLNIYKFQPPLSAGAIFPLLGVWAWLIMWTHYAFWWIKKRNKALRSSQNYGKISMWLVLVLILLHPGLLAWEQYRLFGLLPPDSFTLYVTSELQIFVSMGSLALLLFLAYEVVHRLRNSDWFKRQHGWVSASQAAAMTLIFVHGLMIGETVLYSWMLAVWVLLGIVLAPLMVLAVSESFSISKSNATNQLIHK